VTFRITGTSDAFLKQCIITPFIIHMFESIYIVLVDIMDPSYHNHTTPVTVLARQSCCSPLVKGHVITERD
jgi:hypothetical protein